MKRSLLVGEFYDVRRFAEFCRKNKDDSFGVTTHLVILIYVD